MDLQKITLANGCFWRKAMFQTLKGVKSVTSGYIGGPVENYFKGNSNKPYRIYTTQVK